MFEEDPDDEVLCPFLGVIGGLLQHLTLQVSYFQTSILERITAICPRLRDIDMCTSAIEVRFQVRDSSLRNQITVHPFVPSSFGDISELVMFFCVATLPFARAVQRLRVRIRRKYDDGSHSDTRGIFRVIAAHASTEPYSGVSRCREFGK